MKIAMIGQKGMPALHGGVERHVHELSVRLVERGHTVIAYARDWYSPKKLPELDGVQLVYTPTVHTKHIDTILHTCTSTIDAMKRNVDVYHYHGVGPALLAWLPRLFRSHARVIVTFHSIDRMHEKWGWLAKRMLTLGEWAACRFAHQTVTVSQGIHDYAKARYGKDTVLIHNAVPLYDRNTNTNALEQFGLVSGEYVMVVSRLIAHKGITYLIDAWKQLHEAGVTSGKKLAIVGDGYYSDSYVNMLHKMAAGDDTIVFTGFQSGATLAQLYSHAMMMVHPSDNEGLPLSVLEAMSYGLPVLASDIDGHKDLIRHPAYTFAQSSVKSLAAKLQHMLEAPAHQLLHEGKRNRQKIMDEFNQEHAVQAFEAVYEVPKATVGMTSQLA